MYYLLKSRIIYWIYFHFHGISENFMIVYIDLNKISNVNRNLIDCHKAISFKMLSV